MGEESRVGTPDLLLAEGRVLEAVASGTVLHGTPEELARQLGVRPDDLRIALHELQRVSWIVAHVQPTGRLAVRLERRSPERRPTIATERRGVQPPVWTI